MYYDPKESYISISPDTYDIVIEETNNGKTVLNTTFSCRNINDLVNIFLSEIKLLSICGYEYMSKHKRDSIIFSIRKSVNIYRYFKITNLFEEDKLKLKRYLNDRLVDNKSLNILINNIFNITPYNCKPCKYNEIILCSTS